MQLFSTSTASTVPRRAVGRAQPVRCRAPGTCGEFVQGAINGRDFLVNCPIDRYSTATVLDDGSPGLRVHDAAAFGKTAQALALIADRLGDAVAGEIVVESDLPRGKGMASSTADLSAALAAACRACGLALPARRFAEVLAAVEPSDCVHYDGIAHVNHLTGDMIDLLPAPDGLSVLVVDCGGEVDTVAFDRGRARGVYHRHQPAVCAALALLKHGLRAGDLQAVADAATLSAELSQCILPKPPFEDLLACTREAGALGVCCAHSGTVLGVLHRTRDGLEGRLRAVVAAAFGDDVEVLGNHRVIAGGCHAC